MNPAQHPLEGGDGPARPGGPGEPGGSRSQRPDPIEVGEFRQGTPISQWALSRYLVGQAIGEYLSRSLLALALLVLALAVVVGFFGPTWLAVLIGVVALCVFTLRAMLGAVLRRFAGAALFGAQEPRLRSLVAQTRGDVRRELRRIGVPSHVLTMPLLAARLAGRRRAETAERLRRFDVDRVVPASRLDDLHLIVQSLRPPEAGSG